MSIVQATMRAIVPRVLRCHGCNNGSLDASYRGRWRWYVHAKDKQHQIILIPCLLKKSRITSLSV